MNGASLKAGLRGRSDVRHSLIQRAAVLLGLAGAVASVGCGGGAQCAIDTDCPLGSRCNAAGECAPLTRPDGGVQEAGVVDAATDADETPDVGVDAGPPDAGPMFDGWGDLFFRLGAESGAQLSVTFGRGERPSGGSALCTDTDVDGCVVTTCMPPMPVDAGMPEEDAGMPDAGPPETFPHAGRVSVSRGLARLATDPEEELGIYRSVTDDDMTWVMGSGPIVFDAVGAPMADGAEIPAFRSTQMATAVVEVTQPTSATVRGALLVTWTATGSGGEVVVRLSGARGMGGGSVTATCRFEPDAGAAALIPASVPQALGPGDVSFSVDVEESLPITVTGWDVRLSNGRPARYDAEVPRLLTIENP